MYKPKAPKDRSTSFVVREESNLYDFVFQKMGSMSKSAVKSILMKGQIMVNDQVETQYNLLLHPGDSIKINFNKTGSGLKSSKLNLLYEDEFIIAINKSAGLLSVATDKQEDSTAFRIVMNHMKKQNRNNRLYIVHRLDRETSGVLIFAKQKEIQERLQTYWQQDVLTKTYYAIVEGCLEKKEGTIRTWLNEDPKSKRVYSADFDNGGQESITQYKVVKEFKNYSLLQVELKTGRKNQIRVHMQSIGHPIIGDKKYGGSTSPIGRVGLHAAVLTLRHPATAKLITFKAPLPENMAKFCHVSDTQEQQ